MAQGTVLDPLLFNDINNVTNLGEYVLFAEDLNLFMSNKNGDTLYKEANSVLQNIYQYCLVNRLVINFEKCCFMEFSHSSYQEPLKIISILNYQFKHVRKCKFLGVHFNDNLTSSDQFQNFLMYCAPLWCSSRNSADIQKKYISQKKCIRIVSNKTTKQNNIFQHKTNFRLQISNIFNIIYT